MKLEMIKLIPNIYDLSFLSRIKTTEEFYAKVDSPYLVGHVIHREAFNRCDKQISAEVLQISKILGFGIPNGFPHWDTSPTRIGVSQRTTNYWHIDEGTFYGFSKCILHLRHIYIIASSNGTLFLKDSFSRNYPNELSESRYNRNLLNWIQTEARLCDALIKGEDYGIYLMIQPCWHCSPIQTTNDPRTFFRLCVHPETKRGL